MAAAQRSAPFAVLNGDVNMYELTGEPGQGWRRIECASKKAYGCGDLGQEVVESLRLYTRLGDYPVLTSSLAIRMSDEAVRSIEAELIATSNNKPSDHCVHAGGSILSVDQRLVVIALVFQKAYCTNLVYYLVYEDVSASVSMIKYLPDHYKATFTVTPVVSRRTGGGRGGDYELLLTARNKSPSCADDQGVLLLCACTLETRASTAAPDGIGTPWQIKAGRFPEKVPELFTADVAFACKGKAFWADLSHNRLVYCDLHPSGAAVDFGVIDLPRECQPYLDAMPDLVDEPIKMIQTMGCVGDSIWLVCTHRCNDNNCANDYLTIWSLDLAERQWKQEARKSTKMIRGLAGQFQECWVARGDA